MGPRWDVWKAWTIVCIPLMPQETFKLLTLGGIPADTTPPTCGHVAFAQSTGSSGAFGNVSCSFSGFIEMQSSIMGTQILVSNLPSVDSGGYAGGGGYANQITYLAHWDVGHNSDWSGLVDIMPANGDEVYMCATAVNAAKINTTNCTKAIVWDEEVPTVQIWLWNPVTLEYYQPQCREFCGTVEVGCVLPPNNSMCDTAFTAETDYISFQMRVTDGPVAARHTIASVSWAIRDTHNVVNPSAQAEDLVYVFTQAFDDLSLITSNGRLNQSSTSFKFEHGKSYWIHVYACDQVGNCGWTVSHPIFTDHSPPLGQAEALYPYVIPDRDTNTSADGISYFLTQQMYVRPAWNVFPNNPPKPLSNQFTPHVDPTWCESPSSKPWYFEFKQPCDTFAWQRELGRTEFYVYHLTIMPWLTTRTLVAGPVNAAPGTSWGATLVPNGGLTLGETYQIEVLFQNRAGLVSKLTSPNLVADWTFPFCTMPGLVSCRLRAKRKGLA